MLKNKGYQETFFDNYVWNNFIPPDHKYVKIKGLVNVDFIPDLVKDTYKNENLRGNDSIDPRILFLMCLIQYLENLSDTKVVEKISEVPVLKWFVGLAPQDPVPDPTTLSKFRTHRMGEKNFKESFYKIVGQIKEMGLIDGQIQTQDATALWADIAIMNVFQLLNKCRTNLLKAVSRTDQAKNETLLKKYDFKLERNPSNKQKHFEELFKICQELFDEIKKDRRLLKNKQILKEMKIMGRVLEERRNEQIDKESGKAAEAAKPKDKDDLNNSKGKMISPTDPDASWGAKSEKKFFAGYKAEINLDHLYDFITAIDVMKAGFPEEQGAADLLKTQEQYLKIVPQHFLADAKYSFGTTRAELKALGIDNIYIPEAMPKHRSGKEFSIYSFEWDWTFNNLLCPEDYPAERMVHNEDRMGFEFIFNRKICDDCKSKTYCTAAKSCGRRVFLPHTFWDHKEGYRIMLTEEYKIMYKEQRYKIERKNADMKKWHGFDRARYRGLSRVRIQAYLTAMAVNIKKWVKFVLGKIKNGIEETLAKVIALRENKGVLYPSTG